MFSIALARAGVKQGFVSGASDKDAGFAQDNPVGPQDVTATMYDALGIPPETQIHDRLDRPTPVSTGRVLRELFSA